MQRIDGENGRTEKMTGKMMNGDDEKYVDGRVVEKDNSKDDVVVAVVRHRNIFSGRNVYRRNVKRAIRPDSGTQ